MVRTIFGFALQAGADEFVTCPRLLCKPLLGDLLKNMCEPDCQVLANRFYPVSFYQFVYAPLSSFSRKKLSTMSARMPPARSPRWMWSAPMIKPLRAADSSQAIPRA
jgi:hypothetical protein